MTIEFWTDNPYVLIDKTYMSDIWPSDDMNYTQKMNAISRLVLVLTILGFLTLRSFPILITGIITLGIIYYMFYNSTNNESNIQSIAKEGFTNKKNFEIMKHNFEKPQVSNPMNNVLLPDIQDNPMRKSAPPAFNPKIEHEINKNTKEMIAQINDTNEDIDKRLFQDLGDNFGFEQSMRNFHSMPNTRVPNDQKAFAEYLYGDMKSCKDGDSLECNKNNYSKYPGY
jgi:hypothetical protein